MDYYSILPEDLTARARLMLTALELFSRRGTQSTSMRLIAKKAHLSPSLISHHFGSKMGLQDAVETDLVAMLHRASKHVGSALPGQQFSRFVAGLTSACVQYPVIANFIRRSFCDVSSNGLTRFHEAMRGMLEAELLILEQAHEIVPVEDQQWRATQVMLLLFGASVFDPPLAELRTQDARVPARIAANVELLTHGFCFRAI